MEDILVELENVFSQVKVCSDLEKLASGDLESLKELTIIDPPSVVNSPSNNSVTPPPKPPKRNASINYTFKDLALLKQQKQLNDSPSTETVLPKSPVEVPKTPKRDESLPPEWKEVLDPKSSRYYYVNR